MVKGLMMNRKEVDQIISKARVKGERPNLRYADLSNADLSNADLRNANLRYANLRDANLRDANLWNANLWNADLRNADLRDANLRDANLWNADLRDANLRDANLWNANLRDADLKCAKNIPAYVEAITKVAPETGSFTAWKKTISGDRSIVTKLLIPARAKRSNATTRKCRAEYVKVLGHYEINGKKLPNDTIGLSPTNVDKVEYKVGEMVQCHKWDDDRWNECSGGIHFFMTRYEAEQW